MIFLDQLFFLTFSFIASKLLNHNFIIIIIIIIIIEHCFCNHDNVLKNNDYDNIYIYIHEQEKIVLIKEIFSILHWNNLDFYDYLF